jgi:hypothetical protein
MFTGRHFEFIWNGRPLTANDIMPDQPEAVSIFDDIEPKKKHSEF